MGANHVRAASKIAGVQVVAVVDPHEWKRTSLASTVDAVHASSIEALFADQSMAGHVDAAVVATPTATHHAVSLACIEAGLHVLVEKPFTGRTDQADDLMRRASLAGVILTVGHVERFNAAVCAMSRLIAQPVHIELVRFGPRPLGMADDVVTDLMVHDLDLARLFAGAEATVVSATSHGSRSSEQELVIVKLMFANGVTASVTAGRDAHRKRYVKVAHAGGVLGVDLMSRQITNESDGNVDGDWVPDRVGRRCAPEFATPGDALAGQLGAFSEAVRGGAATVPAEAGRAALALAEQVLQACERPS